jgi:acetylornithine deacetylase/succinyl-diaminopimelate desuccinylase-like protein
MLKPRIGSPDLVVCLDSGCGNYDQLWVTTSLRGIVAGTLRVSITTEGVHSGDSSGVIPDTFRIARKLLDRVDDSGTGVVKVPELNCDIPEARVKQTKVAAGILGDKIHTDFPFLPGAKPASESLVELALNRTWRPTLTVTGAAGLPPLAQAGNVLRPTTALMLSVRIPPAVDPKMAQAALKVTLEADPPYGATVVFDSSKAGPGWESPALAPWLEAAAAKASATYYGKPAVYYGEGGSIPFMGMLGNLFPASQFLIVGVLGPASNAHGPNEFLHVPYAKKLTCVVASVLADHCKLRLGGAGGVAAAADACVHPAKRLKTDFGRDSEGKKI